MTSGDDVFARRQLASRPRRAVAADASRAADTLSAAFADDPVTSWIGRKDARRDIGRRGMFGHLVSALGIPGNELWIADDYSVAALWVPPGQADLKLKLLEEIRLIRTLVSFTGWTGLSRANAFRKATDAQHPKSEPHFYLMTIGVDPKFQGQGLGSALLGATLEHIDAQHMPAYLESSSPKNVPLYRRHGFEVMSEFRPREDGPPLWGMWRKAR
jgi:ribosomal protein S18 acetylase RimI-like enzyme